MKYIRTTYGIYNSKDVYSPDNPKPRYIFKKDIIAQADTIEELCDCKVMVDTFHHITDFLKEDKYGIDRIISFESAFNGLKKHIGKVVNIYGAIWTSKGLKYVAKMNEKGELELL